MEARKNSAEKQRDQMRGIRSKGCVMVVASDVGLSFVVKLVYKIGTSKSRGS